MQTYCTWAVPVFCIFDFYGMQSKAACHQTGTERQVFGRSKWMLCLTRITDEVSVCVAMVQAFAAMHIWHVW